MSKEEKEKATFVKSRYKSDWKQRMGKTGTMIDWYQSTRLIIKTTCILDGIIVR